MWKKTLMWLDALVTSGERPGVYWDTRPPTSDGIVIEMAAGAHIRADALADARLADTITLERLRDVVRFCARRGLPVSVWHLTGVWQIPARVERVAAYVRRLAEQAAPAHLWVDTHGMPARYRQRLEAHLRRQRCHLW